MSVEHGPAAPAKRIPGNGWERSCTCGRTFKSEKWEHVPSFYDHLATAAAADRPSSPADRVREFVRLNRLAGKHRMFSYKGLEFEDLTALLQERDGLLALLEEWLDLGDDPGVVPVGNLIQRTDAALHGRVDF